MVVRDRFFYNPVTKENEFILCSSTYLDDIKFIEENGIKTILVTSDNYQWTDIESIANIKDLNNVILGKGPHNLLDLYKINGIKRLSINGPEGKINFKGLNTVESLFLSYVKGVEGLGTLAQLTDLVLVECKDKKFNWQTEFDGLKKLKTLELTSCILPADLSFFKQNQNLETVEIHYCRSEFSIKSLSTLPSLSKLVLAQCPNIEDIENVSTLQSVKWLRITDSGVIKDCSFISKMKNLEVLIVNGKSYFENGDLTQAVGKLKHFGFDNKKHYSHKMEDFPSVYK